MKDELHQLRKYVADQSGISIGRRPASSDNQIQTICRNCGARSWPNIPGCYLSVTDFCRCLWPTIWSGATARQVILFVGTWRLADLSRPAAGRTTTWRDCDGIHWNKRSAHQLRADGRRARALPCHFTRRRERHFVLGARTGRQPRGSPHDAGLVRGRNLLPHQRERIRSRGSGARIPGRTDSPRP